MPTGGLPNQNNQRSDSMFTAAELALIGELLSTIGEMISTVAAALELEEEKEDEMKFNNLQNQIDELSREIKLLKRRK